MSTGVRFEGDFTAQEREFLGGQFGGCTFDLVARSRQQPGLALVRWSPVGAVARRGGTPGPLFAPPAEAHYVLDTGGPSEPRLDRMDHTRDLEATFPGHFPGVEIRASLWARLTRSLRRHTTRGKG